MGVGSITCDGDISQFCFWKNRYLVCLPASYLKSTIMVEHTLSLLMADVSFFKDTFCCVSCGRYRVEQLPKSVIIETILLPITKFNMVGTNSVLWNVFSILRTISI